MLKSILFACVLIAGLDQVSHADGPIRYRGQWNSQSTGHSGPMRAKLKPQSDGSYKATFAGRFAVIIPFVYRATLEPTGNGSYTSSKQLGPIIGEYRMNAMVTPNQFSAGFQAAKDAGTFNMTRLR